MSNDVTALDAYIENQEQRDLVRVLRFLLYISAFKDHVLVYGDPAGGEEFLIDLMRAYPAPFDSALMVAVRARKTFGSGGFESQMPSEAKTIDILRAFLRQDPDVIAVSLLDAETAELVSVAALTGHRLIIASPAATAEAWNSEFASVVPQITTDVQLGLAIELLRTNEGKVRIKRVLFRPEGTTTIQEIARVEEDSTVTIVQDLVPTVPLPTASLNTPVFAPPVETWPAASGDPRTAFLPVTGESASARSLIGGMQALLPRGEVWPVCKSCGLPLALTVQLDLAALPELYRQSGGVAQFFICVNDGSGCEVFSETDPGVVVVVRADDNLEIVHAPEELEDVVVAPGRIIEWKPFTEEPGYGDAPEVSVDDPKYDEANPVAARHLDKLGGWPAWQQHNEWPLNADGSRMTLLYQIAEGGLRIGGTTSGWDYERAVHIPGDPGARIVDPNKPHHFPSLWSGDAVGMLFIDNTATKLALRVQMG